MGDWLQFLVDDRVGAADAPLRAEEVRRRLTSEGWIVAEADKDCVFGDAGHRPGREVASWYNGTPDETAFTRLRTNGVVIRAARFTNLAAGPYDLAALACPRCGGSVDEDALLESVGGWISGGGDGVMGCNSCSERFSLSALHRADPRESPVVCGNLALTFFNWPILEDSGWKRSVVDAVAEVLGARPSLAWTKL